ncbi:hypothetical protein [Enterococcus avium]|nr:hypothetical protein [Enterococcus avium]
MLKEIATSATWGLDRNTNVLTWLLEHEPTTFEVYVTEKLIE